MVLPRYLILDHFIYKKPAHIFRQTLARERYTKNMYFQCGNKPLRKRWCKRLVGCVFVDEDAAYKIIDVKEAVGFISAIFVIERYTDEYIDKLIARCNSIRQHILVYADQLEDLGGLGVANKFRGQANELLLEDLV